MGNRAKQVAKYYNQCKLPKWATVLGVVLLAFGIVAAGVTAIFHDKYLSIFGAWESALTNVWFIAFIAVVCLGAFLSLGYPLLTALGALIWALFSKPEPKVVEEQPSMETPDVKDGMEVATKEESPTETQRASSTIDEDRLRKLLDTPFMHKQSNGSVKTNLDRVIDDLRIVRINYKKGAKDGIHYSDKSITEIARFLYREKYLKGPLPSFADWCVTLFKCMSITPPDKRNISNNEISESIGVMFNYLLR